jgi:DnaJ-class molecular chaperone
LEAIKVRKITQIIGFIDCNQGQGGKTSRKIIIYQMGFMTQQISSKCNDCAETGEFIDKKERFDMF